MLVRRHWVRLGSIILFAVGSGYCSWTIDVSQGLWRRQLLVDCPLNLLVLYEMSCINLFTAPFVFCKYSLHILPFSLLGNAGSQPEEKIVTSIHLGTRPSGGPRQPRIKKMRHQVQRVERTESDRKKISRMQQSLHQSNFG